MLRKMLYILKELLKWSFKKTPSGILHSSNSLGNLQKLRFIMKTKERWRKEFGEGAKFFFREKKDMEQMLKYSKDPPRIVLFGLILATAEAESPSSAILLGTGSTQLRPSYEAPQRPPTAFSYRSVGFVARRALPKILSKIDLRLGVCWLASRTIEQQKGNKGGKKEKKGWEDV